MRNIKIFKQSAASDDEEFREIENDVNHWIEKNGVDVVDIKHTVDSLVDNWGTYIIMVIYDKKED